MRSTVISFILASTTMGAVVLFENRQLLKSKIVSAMGVFANAARNAARLLSERVRRLGPSHVRNVQLCPRKIAVVPVGLGSRIAL